MRINDLFESITVRKPSDNSTNEVFFKDHRVGYITLSPAKIEYSWLDLDLPNPLAIVDVEFHPEYRGKGLMPLLMDWLEDFAGELGYKTLFLRVDDDSVVSKKSLYRMYKSLGFEEYRDEYMNNEMNGLYMYKPIGALKNMRMWDTEIDEDLRAWFGKGKKGGAGGGGWDAYNSKGERIGKCGETTGSAKPKCLSKSKAASLRNADADGDGKPDGKKGIARAVKRKRRKDPNKNRKGKAKNVKN